MQRGKSCKAYTACWDDKRFSWGLLLGILLARRSYTATVLRWAVRLSVCLSVCPSVRSSFRQTRELWQNEKTSANILNRTKGRCI